MNSENQGLQELNTARSRGRTLLLSAFLFSIFVNLLMLTGPLFMLQVYDRVLSSGSEETLTALFILVMALYAIMGLLDYARGRVLARYGAQFQSYLDERAFRADLLTSTLLEGGKARTTGLRELESVQALFSTNAYSAILDAPWAPLFLIAIFIFHPLLGWLAVLGGGFLIVLNLANQLLSKDRLADANASAFAANNFAEKVSMSSELVRVQGMENAMVQRWQVLRNRSLRDTLGSSDWLGGFQAFTKSYRLFLQSAILALGAYLTLKGEVTAGAMIASSIMLGRALAPVEQLLGSWKVIQGARAGWSTLAQRLSALPPEQSLTKLPKPEPRLTVSQAAVISKIDGRPLLRGVNFDLLPGRALGIIGPSGAGKTSLARLILGASEPAAGTIHLGGALMSQYSAQDVGRYFGYLPQSVTLFDGTIAENIARMDPQPNEEKIIKAAKMANAHEMTIALPDGYNTMVQSVGNLLSGGQSQRIALARAFYEDPQILVLDEPNSALDGEGTFALNEAVKQFKALGRSVIIMTHRPTAISECDDLLMLREGVQVAFGPRDKVLAEVTQNAGNINNTIKSGD